MPPISTTEAFEKRHITRDDGVNVLPRSMIPVAALEAGYHLPTPTIDGAVANTTYPGQMTSEEFAKFCEHHQDSFVSAKELAKSVVVVAPSNVITRGSLEEIMKKSSSSGSALSEEEIDALFQTLDTDNKGAISAEDFMRALHGEEGVLCLHEQRHAEAKEERKRLEKEKAAKEEAARRERQERERKEKEAAERAKREAAAAENKKGSGDDKKQKTSACC